MSRISLRTKAFIIFAVTLSLFIGLVYFISRSIIYKRFDGIQTIDAAHNMQSVLDIIDQDYIRLLASGRDWASWGETYQFILDKNETYITNNLMDETLSNLELNLMLYLDNEKNLVYGKAYDLDNDVRIPLPSRFLHLIMEYGAIWDETGKEKEVSGILLHSDGFPVLFAALPILTNEGTGPVRGTLFLGRFLTPAKLEQISQISRVNLSTITLTGMPLDSENNKLLFELENRDEVFVRTLSRTFSEASVLLEDINGNPAVILKGKMSRDIVLAGESALRLFLFMVIIATVIISFIMALIFEKTILSRLSKIISQVIEIQRTADRSAVIKDTGSDELTLLVQSINEMLSTIHESHHSFTALVSTTPLPIVAIDTDGNVTGWNPAAERTFGWTMHDVLGNPIPIIPPESRNEFETFLKSLSSGGSLLPFETKRLKKDGSTLEVVVYPSRLTGIDGRISGSISVLTDITETKKQDLELRKALMEKDMLLKEVHHRVKNNLQAISSILDIQGVFINNPQIEEFIRDSQNRIHSMALIHEELYKSRDHTFINIRQYVSRIVENLFISYVVEEERIRSELQIDDILMNIDTAIPFGLIINELVSNSLKHAFKDIEGGIIRVGLTVMGDVYRLWITDNGIGLPDDMDPNDTKSLGMVLVRSLAEQLNGTMTISNYGGASFEFFFTNYEECHVSEL